MADNEKNNAREEAIKENVKKYVEAFSDTPEAKTRRIAKMQRDIDKNKECADKIIPLYIETIEGTLQTVTRFIEAFSDNKEVFENIAGMTDAEYELFPFIGLAINDEAGNDPSILNVAPLEILRDGVDGEGHPTNSKYKHTIEKAIFYKETFYNSNATIADLATITEAVNDASPEAVQRAKEIMKRIEPELYAFKEATQKYAKMRNTKFVSELTRASGSKPTLDEQTNKATFSSGELSIAITQLANANEFSVSTSQLLDMALIYITTMGGITSSFGITLEQYMQLRGLKDRKEARKKLVNDLEVIRRGHVEFDTELEDKKTHQMKPYQIHANVCDAIAIPKRGGEYIMQFSKKFIDGALENKAIMQYPTALLKINQKKNPYSYYLGRKIAEHKHMNIEKPNENIISVRTLLAVCNSLPTPEEVKNTDRHYDSRIRVPFERDMDALQSIFTWEYCNSNGVPLSDAQLAEFDFDSFLDALVLIQWEDNYPKLEKKRNHIQEEKADNKKKKLSTKRTQKKEN